MKMKVYIEKKNIIREVLHSYKEQQQYKRALEELFCVVNGWEPHGGYTCKIEDSSYQELYIKTLNEIIKLRASLPDATKNSCDAGK